MLTICHVLESSPNARGHTGYWGGDSALEVELWLQGEIRNHRWIVPALLSLSHGRLPFWHPSSPNIPCSFAVLSYFVRVVRRRTCFTRCPRT
jgi:hypothetical protein